MIILRFVKVYVWSNSPLQIPTHTGVSEYLVRWRRVIKRKRSILMSDVDPNMLTSRLIYLPPEVCTVFEGTQTTDVQQRVKNVETLLSFLLQREEEDWPEHLLKGLQESDQSSHAQTLQEEYDAIVKEEQHLKRMERVDFSEVSVRLRWDFS